MIIKPRLFTKQKFAINPKLCVVLMPIKEQWSDMVYSVFTEVADNIGNLDCWRSDTEFSDDVIIQTIWQKINEAKFIIADCTTKNANVFYELGIAHTLGKPVFMCAQSRSDFVFDIHAIRSYEYDTQYDRIEKLKEELKKFILNLP